MLGALRNIFVAMFFCLVFAGAAVEPTMAAEEPEFVAPEKIPFADAELVSATEPEVVLVGDSDSILLEEELLTDGVELSAAGTAVEVRQYWQGEPLEFVWATFDALNKLQLFTLVDENDAGGFIYGMWVTPGFVLYRASAVDAASGLGWRVDFDAEDERIRPRLSREDDSTLFWNFPNSYEQLASMDKQIDEYLNVICQDLDDLWWFYENLQPGESGMFERPHTMIRGIIEDIQDMETRIQDRLRERNDCYSDAIMKLHPERE